MNPLCRTFTALLLCVICHATAEDLTWLWSTPQPHGNNLMDLLQTNGLYVTMADRGQVHSSMDLMLWKPSESGTARYLRSGAFFGNYLLLTTEQGGILRATASTNGLRDFVLTDLGTGDWLEGLASSGTRLVAVGDNAAIYTSDNGLQWTRETPPFTEWLRSVAWGNGRFVTVGENGLIAVSTDAKTWQVEVSGRSSHLNRVAWVVDRFWAVGDSGTTLISIDGTNWTPVSTGAANALYAVAGHNNLRVVAGDGEMRLGYRLAPDSQDYAWINGLDGTNPAPPATYYACLHDGSRFLLAGSTGTLVEGTASLSGGAAWSTLGESLYAWVWDVMALPQLWIAVGDFGTLATSDDGTAWTLEVPPPTLTNTVFLGVGGNEQALLAVGSQGALALSRSGFRDVVYTNSSAVVVTQAVATLGVLWEAVTSGTAQDLQGVCYAQGQWVVTGGEGTILTSRDGATWSAAASSTSAFLSSVLAWPGGWVAVGDLGTVLTSRDGLSWERVDSGSTNWLYRVRYLQERLIAVGQNGTILVSTNGTQWGTSAPPTTRWLNDLAWFDGRFWTVGTKGTLLSSSDAESWRTEMLPTTKSLYTLATRPWQMLAGGIDGCLLRAQTAPVQILHYGQLAGTNTFVVSGAPAAHTYITTSADLRAWTNDLPVDIKDNTGRLFLAEPILTNRSAAYYKPAR